MNNLFKEAVEQIIGKINSSDARIIECHELVKEALLNPVLGIRADRVGMAFAKLQKFEKDGAIKTLGEWQRDGYEMDGEDDDEPDNIIGGSFRDSEHVEGFLRIISGKTQEQLEGIIAQ